MAFLRTIRWVPILLFCALPWRQAEAVVVFATDFNSDTPGTYANGTVLNSGGTTTDDVSLFSSTDSATTIVDRGGGNNALQFTDNSSDSTLTASPRAASAVFTPLSTTATGNNRLFGSFTYTRLLSTATVLTAPVFAFAASSGNQQLLDSTRNAIRFSVESTGHVFYVVGGATPLNVDSGVLLATGTEYTFTVDSDFSSTGANAQDLWSLTVTPVGSSTPVLNTGWIDTRAADVQVNIISMLGGANQNAVNTAPFGQIDNISFSAMPVPEPASMGFVLTIGGLLLRRKR